MVWWNWIKKKLIYLGVRLEYREHVEFININDTQHLYITYDWRGNVRVTLSPKDRRNEENWNVCGFAVDHDGRVDYLGRTWTVIGSLDPEKNEIIKRNVPEPSVEYTEERS